MGVEHLVLVKFKEGVTDKQVADLVAALQGLATLPGIEKLTTGTKILI